MQSKSIPPATKAEKARFGKMIARGCCACRSDHGRIWLRPVEIHHLLDGGVRRGHQYSVGLCSWHHRGVVPGNDLSVSGATLVYGPSLYHDGKAFKARYGRDDALLAFQEFLLTLPIPGEE